MKTKQSLAAFVSWGGGQNLGRLRHLEVGTQDSGVKWVMQKKCSINLCRGPLGSLPGNRLYIHQGMFHRPWQRTMAVLLAAQFLELTEGTETFWTQTNQSGKLLVVTWSIWWKAQRGHTLEWGWPIFRMKVLKTLEKLEYRPQRAQTNPQVKCLPTSRAQIYSTTVSSIQSKTSRHAKKQKNVAHN